MDIHDILQRAACYGEAGRCVLCGGQCQEAKTAAACYNGARILAAIEAAGLRLVPAKPEWRALADKETIPAGKRWRVIFEPSDGQRALYDEDCAETGEEMCALLEVEYQIAARFVGYDGRVEVLEEVGNE